ncbi:MAG: class I SAM-dependent methyltransferase [Turicibacter sp.]
MIETKIKDINLKFETQQDLFSPKKIDEGTLAMLSVIHFNTDDKVCDLGCGYGVVGILAAALIGPDQVVMVDSHDDAIKIAKQNMKLNHLEDIQIIASDGFAHVNEKNFTKIITHPPYHVDFSVPKSFIEKGFNRLTIGGSLYMVTKRLDWYKNKMKSIFGNVQVFEIDGYFVFVSVKNSISYQTCKKIKLKTRPKERKWRKGK